MFKFQRVPQVSWDSETGYQSQSSRPTETFFSVYFLVTSTRLLTWAMMMRSQSFPLQCRSKRETPSFSNPDPSRTLCWLTNRRTCHPLCPARSVARFACSHIFQMDLIKPRKVLHINYKWGRSDPVSILERNLRIVKFCVCACLSAKFITASHEINNIDNNIEANGALVSDKYCYRLIGKVRYQDWPGSETMWIGASLMLNTLFGMNLPIPNGFSFGFSGVQYFFTQTDRKSHFIMLTLKLAVVGLRSLCTCSVLT